MGKKKIMHSKGVGIPYQNSPTSLYSYPAREVFLHQAIPLLKMAKKQHHNIHLSVEIKSDLAWWKLFASSWNGMALAIP